MFVFDVHVQIAGISEVGSNLLVTQLALRLVDVLGLSVCVCLKSKIAPNRRLSVLFLHESSSHFPAIERTRS